LIRAFGKSREQYLIKRITMRYLSSCLQAACYLIFPLVVLTMRPSTAATQLSNAALDCGGRSPTKYAVVLDASSSLRRDRVLRDSTYHYYARILSMISGALCRNDQLAVYTFAKGPESQMTPLAIITASERSHERIEAIARIRAEDYTRHTDFLVALRRVQGDLVREDGVTIVILVTDGSFFPLQQEPLPWTPDAIRARLTDLGEYVQQIRGSFQLQVLGIGAEREYAVDRDLNGIHWPDRPVERQWEWKGRRLDLKEARGDDLLEAIFGSMSYRSYSDYSLWETLIERPEGPWQQELGYTAGWGLSLHDFHRLKIRHLVFLPPGSSGSRNCNISGSQAAMPRAPQEVLNVTRGRVFCSLAEPTADELGVLHRLQVTKFAFLPMWPSHSDTATLYGLHQVISADQEQTCDPLVMSRHFAQGGSWPPEERSIGSLRIIPLGPRWADTTVDLYRYKDTRCRVPAFSGDEWRREAGHYVLLFSDPEGSMAQSRTFGDPKMWVTTTVLRPGGFPFPPDKIGFLRVCVETLEQIPSGMGLRIDLQGTVHTLTVERGRERCRLQRGRGGNRHLYGFSSIIRLPQPDLRSARLVLIRDDANPVQRGEASWLPLVLVQNGKLFLSLWCLIGTVLVGAAVQVLVLVYFDRDLAATHRPWYKRGSAGTSIVLSAILAVLAAEAVVLAREVDVGATITPLFLASLVLYLIKMAAAALVPEYVEESAWGDIR
jgi:Mg-chelatase subunit ChlD